ncbi:MAG: TonB-dependent receptor, partial [Bacteroidales bacterium]
VGGADWETPVNSGSDMRSWYNNLQIGYAFSDKINTELSVDGNYFQVTTLDSANQNGYDENRMESSVFTRLSAQVTKKINMQVSLRKDFIPNTSPPLTYVLGISFKPSAERNLVAKASVSRNFHNPALNDLYWQPGGNPELLPEEGFSYEAGVHYLYKGKKVNIENQTTFYYSDIDNWILWLPSVKGYWEAMNVKKVKSYGLEFNLQTTLQLNTIKFLLHSNYAFTKTLNYGEPLTSADESKGMQLPFIPVHSGNLLFSMYYRRFYGKFQYQYYGIRHLLSSNKAALEDDSGFFGVEASDNPFYRLYPHHIKHASAGKIFKWGKMEFETEFKVYNLFNEVYRSVLSRPMPKRNYSVLFKISF